MARIFSSAIASMLKDAPVSSTMKCSRGYPTVYLSIVAIFDGGTSVYDLEDPWAFPFMTPSRDRWDRWNWLTTDTSTPYSGGTYPGGFTLTIDAGKQLHFTNTLGLGATCSWDSSGLSNPFHPRALRIPRIDPPYAQVPTFQSVKIWGPNGGVLCQYAPQNWGASGGDHSGCSYATMEAITPASYSVISGLESWDNFAFYPSETPDMTNGYSSIAMFWSGYEPSDFPWY